MNPIRPDRASVPIESLVRPPSGGSAGRIGAQGAGPSSPTAAGDPSRLSVASGRAALLALAQRTADVELLDARSSTLQARLDEVDRLFGELKTAVAGAGTDAAPVSADAQDKIDQIVGSINKAAEQGRAYGIVGPLPNPPSLPPLGSAFSVQGRSPQVRNYAVQSDVGPGGSVGVDVVVLQSAQQAGFFLSLGGHTLELGGAGSYDGLANAFTIELGGTNGVASMSFLSGTSIESIAQAINSRSAALGVRARVSGTGVRLDSLAFGSDDFVSVRMIDDGNINAASAYAGLYRLQSRNTGAADRENSIRFSAALNTFTDQGQDISGTINGQAATGHGTELTMVSDHLAVWLNLAATTKGTGGNAIRLGAMHAFTLVSNAQGDAAPTEQPGAAPTQPQTEPKARLEEASILREEIGERLSAHLATVVRPAVESLRAQLRAAAPETAGLAAGVRPTREEAAARALELLRLRPTGGAGPAGSQP